MNITPAQMVAMMLDASAKIDEAQKELERALHVEVTQHRVFIRAKAGAWREVKGPNREYREAMVDDITQNERYDYENAVADSKAAQEAVRNERQKLSALQSAANSVKEEAALARVGPDLTGFEQHERLGGR